MIGRQIHNVSGRSACDEEGKETLAKVPEEMVGWVMLSGGAESGKEVEQGLCLPLHLGALWESELGSVILFPVSVPPLLHPLLICLFGRGGLLLLLTDNSVILLPSYDQGVSSYFLPVVFLHSTWVRTSARSGGNKA